MLTRGVGILLMSLTLLGGAGIAGGIVIAIAGHGRNRRLAFWVTIAGIVLSGFGFWIIVTGRSTP